MLGLLEILYPKPLHVVVQSQLEEQNAVTECISIPSSPNKRHFSLALWLLTKYYFPKIPQVQRRSSTHHHYPKPSHIRSRIPTPKAKSVTIAAP